MPEDTFDHTVSKGHRSGKYVPVNIPADKVLTKIKRSLSDAEIRERKGNRAEIRVSAENVKGVLSEFKGSGYDHFVALTCIDLLDEGTFELVYHLFSYGSRVHAYVKTMIDRKKPRMDSVVEVFRQAITYEREIKEMFGVDFPGNPRLTQFILEEWEGPPPMRKDFDSIQYVRDTFEMEVRNPKGLPPSTKRKGDA